MEIELREELEGEGDRAWEGEAGRLLALGKTICLASFGEAGTDSDLVLSMTLSALPRPLRWSLFLFFSRSFQR